MDTYTPVRGMIVCASATGDYVKKADVVAWLVALKTELMNHRAYLSDDAYRAADALHYKLVGEPKPGN